MIRPKKYLGQHFLRDENIARKIIGRDQPGVSLFLGMPVPVVTVPHGTAYDIAWKGAAKHSMIVRAITMAAALAGKGL